MRLSLVAKLSHLNVLMRVGEQSRVRIWIVDQGGVSWVEHGQPDAHWISRLVDAPDIVLTRDGQIVNYTGAPDPDAHALYHELRREKYGWADQLIEMLGGGGADCTGLPVRLQLSP